MTQTIVLGGGCFWCIEAVYQLVKGVTGITSGYAGGENLHPTYETVSSGTTGHAEVVKITFDDQIISLDEVLAMFWIIHDPTTPNRQGADIGPQYRSIILYTEPSQKEIIDTSTEEASRIWGKPVVTEISELDTFYPAESYHQNYFNTHPEQGYCQAVINPKLQKLRQKFADKLL